MQSKLFIGVDIGTSVVKGTIINMAGEIVSQHASLMASGEEQSDGYEHDPDRVWWAEFVRLVGSLLSDIGDLRNDVACLAVTGMIPNITPLDSDGHVLHNGLLFYDSRAYSIEQQLDEELKTPRWQNEVLSKLIWLRNRLGADWEKVDKVLTTHSYIVFKLTGQHSVDVITALESGSVYSPAKRTWNDSLLRDYGFSRRMFPDVYAPTGIIGTVSDEAARVTGLNPGIPVICGTGDTISTIVGAGLRSKNDMLIYYGTYNCSALLLQEIGDVLSGQCPEYPLEWIATIPRSGKQLSALAQQFLGMEEPNAALERLDTLAQQSVPGANGVLFIQTVDLPRSTVSTEPRGALINLGIRSTVADICRAMLEAFGYGLHYSFQADEPLATAERCYAAGGGAKSPIWKQVVSDITGREQIYHAAADRGYGSALLAGVGLIPDFLNRIDQQMVSRSVQITPDASAGPIYAERYRGYRAAIDAFNLPPD